MSGENTYNQTPGSNYTNPKYLLKHSKLKQIHEKDILSTTNKHELETLEINNQHNIEIKKKELGWFGLFFGGKELISLNISGVLIIFLILVGFIISCLIYHKTNDIKNITEIWGIITPIITLTLGYLFGNKNG
ncbi:MAG: hypothetical protein RL059_234 [Bacteroidota bacterium]|jgi:hypothetical protein